MTYINVNMDIDVDDIIDSMSKSEKRNLINELSDKDLLDAVKDRRLTASKGVSINDFIMLDNYKKRETFIQLLDLNAHVTDEQIIEAIKNNI